MTVVIKCGVYGQKVHGRVRAAVKGDTCDVSEEEAKRIVGLGIAEYVDVSEPKAVEEEFETAVPESEEVDYDSMTVNDLKELCDGIGIKYTKKTTKAELIHMIESSVFPGVDNGDVIV